MLCVSATAHWSDRRAAMSDVAPLPNAFDKLMSSRQRVCTAKDPFMHGGIYMAWLAGDPTEPLFGIPYIGQFVRSDEAEKGFEARRNEHLYDAAREMKTAGLHAMLDQNRPEDVEWRLMYKFSGPRSEVQEWADSWEIRLIAEYGGVLQDMNKRGLYQTLNLTKGGKGEFGAAQLWASIDARRRVPLYTFQAAMEVYVDEVGNALVPVAYVTDDGYPLGVRLKNFRRGHMRKGLPEQADIEAWADALPGVVCNARESDEWLAARAQRCKDRVAEETPEALAERVRKTNATKATRTVEQRAESRCKQKTSVDARSVEQKAETKAKKSATWAARTVEQRAESRCKQKASVDAIGAEQKAGASNKQSAAAAAHAATLLAAELVRARKIKVPWEGGAKRRAEMHAASKDYSLKRKSAKVLYMISEDGKTIRRVQTDGDMGTRYIVGPVKDSADEEAGPSEAGPSAAGPSKIETERPPEKDAYDSD